VPKLLGACTDGSQTGSGDKKDPQLIGEASEVNLRINNQTTRALLDTGSVVSLVSQTFQQHNLPEAEIRPLDDILKIECADGEPLPYLGYIVAAIDTSVSLPDSAQRSCLFLVVPDTRYSAKTPIILGTTILNTLLGESKDKFGSHFLQKAKLQLLDKFHQHGFDRERVKEEQQ